MNAFRQEVERRRASLPPDPVTFDWANFDGEDQSRSTVFMAWATAHTEFLRWYQESIDKVDLAKCRKRIEIHCGIATHSGRLCKRLMGQVFETKLGGMFIQKYRYASDAKSDADLDAAKAQLVKTHDKWIAKNPGDHSGGHRWANFASRDEYVDFWTRQAYAARRRYLIREKDERIEWPPDGDAQIGRHVLCEVHGFYPFDLLPLEASYKKACQSLGIENFICSDAYMPPSGLPVAV